jgi:hypothetical protein
MEFKKLLKNYQTIGSDKSSENNLSHSIPAPPSVVGHQTQFYSIYEKIWKENLSKSVDTDSIVIPALDSLALLFIIIDDLPHELIWRLWLHQTLSKTTVRIFIHAKYPDRIHSPWVRSHLVNFHYFPEWGSIEITKVMIDLLREVYFFFSSSSSRVHSSLCFSFFEGNKSLRFCDSFLFSF